MIWKSCDLQIKEGQTEDVLGNQTGGKWSTVKKRRYAGLLRGQTNRSL